MRTILSKHALQRMEEMEVSRAEVESAISDPAVTYLGQHHSPPETIAIRGRVAVAYVVEDDEPWVLTVLWHGQAFERPPINVAPPEYK